VKSRGACVEGRKWLTKRRFGRIKAQAAVKMQGIQDRRGAMQWSIEASDRDMFKYQWMKDNEAGVPGIRDCVGRVGRPGNECDWLGKLSQCCA
jgi:hypothetical protein